MERKKITNQSLRKGQLGKQVALAEAQKASNLQCIYCKAIIAMHFSRVFVSELAELLWGQRSTPRQVHPRQPASSRGTGGAGPAEPGCTRGTAAGNKGDLLQQMGKYKLKKKKKKKQHKKTPNQPTNQKKRNKSEGRHGQQKPDCGLNLLSLQCRLGGSHRSIPGQAAQSRRQRPSHARTRGHVQLSLDSCLVLQTTRHRLRAPQTALQSGQGLLITVVANCTREQDPPRGEMTPQLLFILTPYSSVPAA